MSALAELQNGEVGPDFTEMLRRTVRAVAISRNFPPPNASTWTKEAVFEVADTFLAHPQTKRRLEDLAIHCSSEQGLAARLQGAVRNFLADLGRDTDVGRLIRRIKRLLKENPNFMSIAGGRWTLSGGKVEPSVVSPQRLRAVADREPVITVPKWTSISRRNPLADRDSLIRLVVKVLKEADGSLTGADIAIAIATRLGAISQPLTIELDAGERSEPVDPRMPFDVTSDQVLHELAAKEIFEMLSDRQRITLAHADLTTRELAPKLGVGSSQAHAIRQHTASLLRRELAEEEGGESVAELLLQLSKTWVSYRTKWVDLT